MPTKKVESKEVNRSPDVTALTFFECEELKREIAIMAEQNQGELTDEQVAQLVLAQTQSITRLGKLCNFLKLLESKIELCKQRKAEINDGQKHAENVLERLGSRLAEWVESQGKSVQVGEYELKSRRSKSVRLLDGFDDPMFCAREQIIKITPDKARIKEALESGEQVGGAELIEKVNLTIK